MPHHQGVWSGHARDTIRRVWAAHPDADEPELRRHLRAAYPFGARRHWPYKVWLAEVRTFFRARNAGQLLGDPRRNGTGRVMWPEARVVRDQRRPGDML